MTTNKKRERKIWQEPWRYKEGLFVSMAILLLGFSLEVVTKGSGMQLLSFPNNIFAALFIISLIVVLHFTNKIENLD